MSDEDERTPLGASSTDRPPQSDRGHNSNSRLAGLLGFSSASSPTTKTDRKILKCGLLQWVNMFLYGFSYWLCEPVALPSLTKRFDGDALSFGGMQALFGVCQVISALLFGFFFDLLDGKWMLIIALVLGCCGNYLFYYFSTSLGWLYAAKFFGRRGGGNCGG